MEAQRDKFVSHSEVPVLCVSGSDVSLVGYKQQLVRCHDIEQGVIALVSFFYAFHIQFDTKRSAFMHLLQHVLVEKCTLGKRALQLMRNLNM